MTEMPCSRKGCNAIDYRIEVVGKGYICWGCAEEIREKAKAHLGKMLEEEAKAFVYAFLETDKPSKVLRCGHDVRREALDEHSLD